MAAKLKLTVAKIQNPARLRTAVAKVIRDALKQNGYKVGPKLDQDIDIVQADLLSFLQGAGIADAEREAKTILADVLRATGKETLK